MNLVWFRKDLRIYDNPALTQAAESGNCKAVYISTPVQWRHHHVAPIQADFIERHLNELAEQLLTLGITLEHIVSTDFTHQITQLLSYCKKHNIKNIYANSEVELNEHNRDKKLQRDIHNTNMSLHLSEADVIVGKGKILNGDKTMYKVFTPFRNSWVNYLNQYALNMSPPPTIANHGVSERPLVATKITLNIPKVCSKKWPLSSYISTHIIQNFLDKKHDEYKEYRDHPALKATSGLSPYLAIGAISPKALLFNILQKHPQILENPKADIFCWLNELAWRDFYKHLLFHYPELCKHQNFQRKYDGLVWRNTPAHFKAWSEGKTGYPLVDAAMKQLITTGWMHNRLRMVVASFLTKHLLIDWRLGETFFMQHLIDGDFSANNGGWQWAASTGCDAQPYFRIFNPIKQSERFDPDGSFIKKYIPELKNVPAKQIHFPHKYLASIGEPNIYPEPIVDHKTARLETLSFYKTNVDGKG